MKYVSLFAGIGGFDLALNRLGHEAVYVNEWDKYSAQTYEKNFSNNSQSISEKLQDEKGRNGTSKEDRSDSLLFGHGERTSHRVDTRDITTVPTSEIPDHDLLVGGFPCQSFSIAGKRRGFDDTRGTLFFDIARILKDKRPRYFILENVKGLLSHDEGKTFQTILGVLSDLGYDYQWQVLNSKNFGVPQNRERVFIVGHIRGQPRPKVFPIGTGNEKTTELYRQQVTGAITARQGQAKSDGDYIVEGNGQTLQQMNNPKHSNDRVYSKKGLSPTLNSAQGGRRQPKIIGGLQDHQTPRDDGNSPTLPSAMGMGGGHTPILLDQIRRLTPLECERLQGFPDNWTEGVSDTQRYKQLGNAVTVNVVYEVAKHL